MRISYSLMVLLQRLNKQKRIVNLMREGGKSTTAREILEHNSRSK